jgi:hypothetical protein
LEPRFQKVGIPTLLAAVFPIVAGLLAPRLAVGAAAVNSIVWGSLLLLTVTAIRRRRRPASDGVVGRTQASGAGRLDGSWRPLILAILLVLASAVLAFAVGINDRSVKLAAAGAMIGLAIFNWTSRPRVA